MFDSSNKLEFDWLLEKEAMYRAVFGEGKMVTGRSLCESNNVANLYGIERLCILSRVD